MTKKKIKKKEEETKELTIKWHIPDDIISRFATNMTIQPIKNEVKICFFEVKPKIVLPGQEIPNEIQADCIASLIVTNDRLQGFVDAMLTQVKRQSIKK